MFKQQIDFIYKEVFRHRNEMKTTPITLPFVVQNNKTSNKNGQ
jgi:hypothetical protein